MKMFIALTVIELGLMMPLVHAMEEFDSGGPPQMMTAEMSAIALDTTDTFEFYTATTDISTTYIESGLDMVLYDSGGSLIGSSENVVIYSSGLACTCHSETCYPTVYYEDTDCRKAGSPNTLAKFDESSGTGLWTEMVPRLAT